VIKSDPKVPETSRILESADVRAKILLENFDKRDCKAFVRAFPNAFETFSELYGYDDTKGGRNLYSKYETHIPYFFDCSEVSDSEKLRIVVGVGIDGRWDADAIGLFQDLSFKFISKHPKETEEILNSLVEDQASSYWYFLFDGPHPNDKRNLENGRLLSNLMGSDGKQSKLLLLQIRKLQNPDD
jgi:hypothetical protein